MLRCNVKSWILAAAVVAIGTCPVLAASPVVVSFRLGKWKEAHFKDAMSAKRHYDTVRQLGCEAKQDSHDGHHDVKFRAPKWRSLKLKNEQLADQWTHWFEGNGFEAVVMQPPKSGHLEVVAYRLPRWKSGHFDSQAKADAQADTLRMLGCEVKQDSHSGHFDVAFRVSQWRAIGIEGHEGAHQWEKWLKANGFETSHEHRAGRSSGAPGRR